ncbi:hypothetical protein AB7W87_21950, partial [Providencia alcalifaciens]
LPHALLSPYSTAKLTLASLCICSPQLSELLLTTSNTTHLFTIPISLHFSDELMLNLSTPSFSLSPS